MHDLFRFLSNLIPAAIIVLPIMFYYLHKRNLLRIKKEILLKEIEKGSIVDPEMLAQSLTNPVSEEQRLQNNLRNGIIFSFAGVVIAVATIIFYVYLNGIYAQRANGSTFNVDDLVPITLVVTLVLVVAAIVLGVGIAFLVSYFNQKKRMNKTA
jgi:ABC-type Fe3+ transport system permease subunit